MANCWEFWKQTQSSNDKTIIVEFGYCKISWFVNVSQISYLPQLRLWQIIICSPLTNHNILLNFAQYIVKYLACWALQNLFLMWYLHLFTFKCSEKLVRYPTDQREWELTDFTLSNANRLYSSTGGVLGHLRCQFVEQSPPFTHTWISKAQLFHLEEFSSSGSLKHFMLNASIINVLNKCFLVDKSTVWS